MHAVLLFIVALYQETIGWPQPTLGREVVYRLTVSDASGHTDSHLEQAIVDRYVVEGASGLHGYRLTTHVPPFQPPQVHLLSARDGQERAYYPITALKQVATPYYQGVDLPHTDLQEHAIERSVEVGSPFDDIVGRHCVVREIVTLAPTSIVVKWHLLPNPSSSESMQGDFEWEIDRRSMQIMGHKCRASVDSKERFALLSLEKHVVSSDSMAEEQVAEAEQVYSVLVVFFGALSKNLELARETISAASVDTQMQTAMTSMLSKSAEMSQYLLELAGITNEDSKNVDMRNALSLVMWKGAVAALARLCELPKPLAIESTETMRDIRETYPDMAERIEKLFAVSMQTRLAFMKGNGEWSIRCDDDVRRLVEREREKPW